MIFELSNSFPKPPLSSLLCALADIFSVLVKTLYNNFACRSAKNIWREIVRINKLSKIRESSWIRMIYWREEFVANFNSTGYNMTFCITN